jgi:DNA polymerase-3 subunit alpha
MGKKDKAEMARQQARFVDGAMMNGVKKDDAVTIFELVDKFAGYGFNKSHAAAYALVSYHTAYLKANFREESLAASMTLDMGNTDKLAMFAAEAKKSGIPVLPPCVNASEVDFLVETIAETGAGKRGARAIRYSLAALKNIGASAVETIVAGRASGGAYRSLADFAARLNPRALNKRGLETLASAGAFDGLEPNRALVRGNVEGMIALAHRQADNATQGTSDLFGGGGGGAPALDLKPAKPWTPMERLQAEFEAVGFFLSGHPLDGYETVLRKLGVRRYVEFEAATERGASSGRIAGIVISARERRSQKGNKFAFALFSDASGQFEAVIFSDTLNACRDLLEAGTPVVLNVEAERDGDTVKMRVQSMEALDKAAAEIERGLRIVFDTGVLAARRSLADEFKALLKPGQGGARKGGEVRLVLPVGARELEIVLPGRYDVSPAQAGQLSTVPGVVEVLEI